MKAEHIQIARGRVVFSPNSDVVYLEHTGTLWGFEQLLEGWRGWQVQIVALEKEGAVNKVMEGER